MTISSIVVVAVVVVVVVVVVAVVGAAAAAAVVVVIAVVAFWGYACMHTCTYSSMHVAKARPPVRTKKLGSVLHFGQGMPSAAVDCAAPAMVRPAIRSARTMGHRVYLVIQSYLKGCIAR